MMARAERILAALRRWLGKAVPFPPELVTARFAGDGGLRDAVGLALDQLDSPHIHRPSPVTISRRRP